MATTTRSRSTSTATRKPRARKSPVSAPAARRASKTSDAKSAVQTLRASTTKAIQSVPVNRTTISIAVAALSAAALAGVAALLGRERLTKAATASRETLKKVADDVSTVAHEKIDQARSNITKLRDRDPSAITTPAADMAIAS